MLARAVPEMPCDVLLEIEAWQALYGAIHHCPTPPDRPPSLGEAVRWIAQLGGFVGRRHRDQPGPETLWRGLQHLTDLTRMYRIMGFDHGVGHSLLLLYDAKALNYQKSKECKGLGHYPSNTALSVF